MLIRSCYLHTDQELQWEGKYVGGVSCSPSSPNNSLSTEACSKPSTIEVIELLGCSFVSNSKGRDAKVVRQNRVYLPVPVPQLLDGRPDAASCAIACWSFVGLGFSVSNNAAAWSLFWCFSPILHFPPWNKPFCLLQIAFWQAKFRRPPIQVHTSLLLFCMLCGCLHKDISQQDGTSKRLFEICDTVLQKSLGTDAGAAASPSGTTEKSFKAYKTCSTSVPNMASWLCLCICVKPHNNEAQIYFISLGTHLLGSWVGIFFFFVLFFFFFFLSGSERKIHLH